MESVYCALLSESLYILQGKIPNLYEIQHPCIYTNLFTWPASWYVEFGLYTVNAVYYKDRTINSLHCSARFFHLIIMWTLRKITPT
jgi:hypothetical protein